MASRIAGLTTGTGNTGSTVTPQTGQEFLESALPGISNLTTSATGVIGNLLNGLPSPSQARTTNAYFGVGAGQPDTGGVDTFISNRGADLYNQQSNAAQQQGLAGLENLISSITSPELAAQGQALQNQQFGQNLSQQGSEFQQSQAQQDKQFQEQFGLQQFQAMLQALGLGNSVVGPLQGNLQQPVTG